MPNPNGRQSLVQIELAGKLPHEQPDYLTTNEWELLKLHVNEGSTIKVLADLEGIPYNKMMACLQRLGALVARSLELPDSSLSQMDISEPRPKAANRPKAGKVASAPEIGGRRCAVGPVVLEGKYEHLDGVDLYIKTDDFQTLSLNGLPRAAARDFEVGKTYNLYLG